MKEEIEFLGKFNRLGSKKIGIVTEFKDGMSAIVFPDKELEYNFEKTDLLEVTIKKDKIVMEKINQ